MNDHFQVIARCKPSHELSLWSLDPEQTTLTAKTGATKYALSRVLGESTTHVDLYQQVIAPKIALLLDGSHSNLAVVAYGPSSSGKTHTVFGTAGQTRLKDEARGIIFRCGEQLLRELQQRKCAHSMTVSFLQVFEDGRVADLFDTKKRNMEIEFDESSLTYSAPSATKQKVSSSQEVLRLVEKGYLIRNATGCVKEPLKKPASSMRPLPLQQYRPHCSHAVFRFNIQFQPKGLSEVQLLQVCVVDLAGRGIDSQPLFVDTGIEALHSVMATLSESPTTATSIFAQSNLTKLLKPCFGGNCDTILIANLPLSSPSTENCLHLLSQAIKIKNFAKKTTMPLAQSDLLNSESGSSVHTSGSEVSTQLNTFKKVTMEPERIKLTGRKPSVLPPVKLPAGKLHQPTPPSPLFMASRAHADSVKPKEESKASSDDSLSLDTDTATTDEDGSTFNIPVLSGPPPPPLRGIPHFNPDSPLSSQLTSTPLIPSITARPPSSKRSKELPPPTNGSLTENGQSTTSLSQQEKDQAVCEQTDPESSSKQQNVHKQVNLKSDQPSDKRAIPPEHNQKHGMDMPSDLLSKQKVTADKSSIDEVLVDQQAMNQTTDLEPPLEHKGQILDSQSTKNTTNLTAIRKLFTSTIDSQTDAAPQDSALVPQPIRQRPHLPPITRVVPQINKQPSHRALVSNTPSHGNAQDGGTSSIATTIMTNNEPNVALTNNEPRGGALCNNVVTANNEPWVEASSNMIPTNNEPRDEASSNVVIPHEDPRGVSLMTISAVLEGERMVQRSEGSLGDVSNSSTSITISSDSNCEEARDQFSPDMQQRVLAMNRQGYVHHPTRRQQLPPLEHPPSYPGIAPPEYTSTPTTTPPRLVSMETSAGNSPERSGILDFSQQLSNQEFHLGALEGMKASELKQLALQYGVDYKDHSGRTPLMYGVLGNQPKVCEQLIKLRAAINIRDSSGLTPLLWATYLAKAEVVRVLLKGGADPFVTDSGGRTVFHWAMKTPNFHCLKWLCKHANLPSLINKTDNEGLTALHWAVMAEQAYHIRHLLTTTSANVNIRDQEGRPPLTYAVLNFSPACIRAILEIREEAVNLADDQGRTALHYACAEGSADCVRTLLSFRNCDLHCMDNRGTTPLHWAAAGNQPGLLQLLMRRGADRAYLDNSGMTPLDHAQERGHTECVKILQTYGLRRPSSALSIASHVSLPMHGGAPPTLDEQGHVILRRPNPQFSLSIGRLPADGEASREDWTTRTLRDQSGQSHNTRNVRERALKRLSELCCCSRDRRNVVAPITD